MCQWPVQSIQRSIYTPLDTCTYYIWYKYVQHSHQPPDLRVKSISLSYHIQFTRNFCVLFLRFF